ncbi:hypothetical protein lerEdw1_015003 [Lerista edwardsae]|nr:hypothetical protein lerEdw1_015003 [Lerista edwardsae]
MESLIEMTTEFWRSVSSPEEQHLLKMMSYGLAGSMILSSLITHYVGIPYGRHSSAAFGFSVPARLAWLVQEAPSLVIPLHVAFCSDGARLHYWPNRILLGLFLIHYIYRCGLAMWLSGLLINIHSDHILRNLRKPGETGYKIPRGGMFEYVTGANFFGEIVEWSGFALASCTLESAAFALSTFLTLGRRAQQHHEWYLKRFDNYPPTRKILIPFLY